MDSRHPWVAGGLVRPLGKASLLSQTLAKSQTLKLRDVSWTGGAACYPRERVGTGVPRAGEGPA